MKIALIALAVALSLAFIPSDSRRIKSCGYSSGAAAKRAGEAAALTQVLPDETWSATLWDANCTSNCCYEVVFVCDQVPQP